MQRLQITLYIIIFLISATTYSQVALVETSSTTETTIDQNILIENVITEESQEFSKVVETEESLTMIRVHSSAKRKPLKSKNYIWNGKQWEVNDISITAYDKGMA